jgi:acyl-ACP thioesterase
MPLVYEAAERITYYDLDCYGRFKLSALLRAAHIAADVNANQLGIGYRDLAAHSMGFILQRFGVSAVRLPEDDENVMISTWPASIERGAFIRCGRIESLSGENLVEWTSLWVLFDINARKILKPGALPVQLDCAGMRGVGVTADRVDANGSEGEFFSEHIHTVSFSETDSNMHMNNTFYGDMAADAVYGSSLLFPAETPGEWKSAQINYRSEARAGDRIKLRCAKNGAGYIITGATDQKRVFAASVGV